MADAWPAAPVVSLGVLAAAVSGAAWSSVARFPTCLWLLLTAIAVAGADPGGGAPR
jgi:hypothetical protein